MRNIFEALAVGLLLLAIIGLTEWILSDQNFAQRVNLGATSIGANKPPENITRNIIDAQIRGHRTKEDDPVCRAASFHKKVLQVVSQKAPGKTSIFHTMPMPKAVGAEHD
jgi:hypothetical protein